MERIHSNRDARIWYGILRDYISRETERPGFLEGHKDKIDAIKRDLRRFSHKPPHTYTISGHKVYARIIKDFGMDGFIELVRFPEYVDTLAAAEEFFDAYIYRECRASMYDCTGDSFTNWRKIFVRRGEYWCYHSVSFDV